MSRKFTDEQIRSATTNYPTLKPMAAEPPIPDFTGEVEALSEEGQPRDPNAVLSVVVKEHQGQARLVDFTKATITIGRGEHNDIVLPHGNVSHRHCLIRREGHQVLIEDVGSTNGTFVNRVQIEGPVVLEKKDRVAIGQFFLKLAPPPPPPKRRKRNISERLQSLNPVELGKDAFNKIETLYRQMTQQDDKMSAMERHLADTEQRLVTSFADLEIKLLEEIRRLQARVTELERRLGG